MIMKDIDIDVLGRWESAPGLETPHHVMRSLLRHGIMMEWFVPGAVLFQQDEQLLIYDPDKEKMILSFDVQDIRDPTAFVRQDTSDDGSGFSRVVVFSLAESGHFNFNNIFLAVQCLRSDPHDLVEKLLQLNGRQRTERRMSSSSISSFASVHRRGPSSSLSNQGSDTPRNRTPVPIKSPVIAAAVTRTESFGLDRPSFIYDRSEDQAQKDTILLNYCTNDIEKLCRELKSSRKQEEDSRSIHSFRATEFTSAFQKVKLAFNLLGRLNPVLRDPNAADIVHHLLPPLAFLMDSGIELFDDELQKDVISPLLTRRTITFLKHCLTSKELLIWEACGPPWTQPRGEYPGESVPYHPTFHDGWSPGYLDIVDEDEVDVAPRRQNSQRSRQRSPSVGTESDYGSNNSFNPFPETIVDAREEFRDQLIERDALVALVIHPWTSKTSKELTVEKGEYLEILNNDKKWWRCRNSKDKVGYIPYTLLTTLVKAEQAWEAEQRKKKERSFRNVAPRTPSSSPDRAASPAPSLPPPPPPQPIARKASDKKRDDHKAERKRSNSIRSTYSMHDELKNIMHVMKESKKAKENLSDLRPQSPERPTKLNIQITPDVFIDQKSTTKDVKLWLREKEFSSRVLEQLDGMNGNQILNLDRKNLESTFGKEEGGRLDSQLILCRKKTRYTQGKSSELRKILEKAKQRSEKAKAMEEEIDQYFDDEADV